MRDQGKFGEATPRLQALSSSDCGTGELQGIQDYRRLNKVTVKDRYPLPLIQDILNRAQGSNVFTKMDLRWGFNNTRI
jgi:hypothetical protein